MRDDKRRTHLVTRTIGGKRAACGDVSYHYPLRLVETVGEVTCKRCKRVLRRIYGPRPPASESGAGSEQVR